MQDNREFMNKYYTEGAQAKMEIAREQWSPKLQEQATAAWMELFRDVKASLYEDPAGPKAQELAARWKDLVAAFTGGDPEVSAGLRNAWSDRPNWPDTVQRQTAAFSDRQVWDFIGKAMSCQRA